MVEMNLTEQDKIILDYIIFKKKGYLLRRFIISIKMSEEKTGYVFNIVKSKSYITY